MNKQIRFTVVLLIMLCSSTSFAQNFGEVSIHGFGGWAYGKTFNKNSYMVGSKEGSYDYINFSLNMSTSPYENLRIHSQTSYNENANRTDVELDYAFAEWLLSDRVTLRMGKVIAPCMLYTEIYNVGTLRPFLTLPQGMYNHFAPETYKGIGLTGLLYSDGGWEVLYDLYGGKIQLKPIYWVETKYEDPNFGQEVNWHMFADNMFGERLSVSTPIDGLSLTFSGYLGDITALVNDKEVREIDSDELYTFRGYSIEYDGNPWMFRTEFMRNDKKKYEFIAGYAETAFHFTEKWQIAGRFEFEELDGEGFINEAPQGAEDVESVYEHRDFSLGLNYWFNPNFVIKTSIHHVDGNVFAKPSKVLDYFEGSVPKETDLVLIGTQFSF